MWTNIKILVNLNMSSDFPSDLEQLTLNQLVRGLILFSDTTQLIEI